MDWRGDNAGPPMNSKELIQDFEAIEREFPGAEVVASTFDKFVAALENIPDENFPTHTEEIGDTWIHGIASDPLKLAKTRIMQTEATKCLKSGLCSASNAQFWQFFRFFLKNVEHTWGLDNKSTLTDYVESMWSNKDLITIINSASGNLHYCFY